MTEKKIKVKASGRRPDFTVTAGRGDGIIEHKA
jgi:hypothetical protein